MEEVKSGDKYVEKIHKYEVEVNNVWRKGVGYQICYKQDGSEYGLVTSRTNFLHRFKKINDNY